MATANVKAVITAEDKASKKIAGVGTSFGKLTASMAVGQLVANGISKAFNLLTDTLKKSVGAAFDQVRQVENSTIALRAYEKNGAKVNKVLKDLIAYARSDMGVLFQREDLFAAAQTLKLYGQTTDTLVDKVKILSKGVSLGKTTFQELSSIVGRAAAKGRLDAVDFDMLIERGIGLDKSFRGAKVTSEELFKALDKALPAELLKGRANTIDGLMIRLQSAFRDVGSAILGVNTETSEFIKGGLGDQFIGWIKTLTEFLKSPEFKAAIQQLINWLAINLPLAINWLKNEGFPALIAIFQALWPVIKTTVEIMKSFLTFVKDNTWILYALGAAFLYVRTSMKISQAVAAFNAGMKAIGLRFAITKGILMTPIHITIAIGAALIALQKIKEAAIDTWDAIDQLGRATAGMNSAKSDAKARLERIVATGNKTERARAQAQLDKGIAAGTFASGGFTGRGGMNEPAGIVHKGEYVVPKNQVDQTTGTPKMSGNTTINISVPMMTGSATERRKVARMLIKDLQDIASMNGKSVTDMLSSNYGLVT